MKLAGPRSGRPAVLAYERDESRRSDVTALELLTSLRVRRENLFVTVTNRDQQSTPFRELFGERSGYRGRPGSHENRVVRRVLPPTERTVAGEQRHVHRTCSTDRVTRLRHQRADALDRKHLGRQVRQQHRLISGARADLQHALVPRQRQLLEISRMRTGLGDRLTVSDRQGAVLVRTVAHPRGHEEMSWSLIERMEHGEIAHAPLLQCLDEPSSSPRLLAAHGSDHQSFASSSIRKCVGSRVRGVTATNPPSTARKSESSAPLHEAEPPPIQ